MPGPASNPVPPETRVKYSSLAELTAIPVGKLYAEGAEMLRQKYLNLRLLGDTNDTKSLASSNGSSH